MAVVTKDIAGGSNHYPNIAAFLADESNAEFTGNDMVGVVYANQSTTSAWNFTGTNAASITLKPASGSEHDGTADGSGITLTGTVTNRVIQINRASVTIQDFRIVANGSGAYAATGMQFTNAAAHTVKILRNLIIGDGGSYTNNTPYGIRLGTTSTAGTSVIANNIVANFRNATVADGIGIDASYGTKVVLNNTVYNCYTGIYAAGTATCHTVNNISVGNTTADYSVNPSSDKLNNIYTNGGTPFGSAYVQAPGTLTDLFADIAASTLDLHLANGSTVADAAGVDASTYSADATNDIDRVARSGSWDIGADQFVASIPPPAPGETFSITNARALAKANAEAAAVNAASPTKGYIVIYDSVPSALVTVTLNDPPYEDAVMVGTEAVCYLSTTPSAPSGVASGSGTAATYKVFDGNAVECRSGSVTDNAGDGPLKLANTTISAGDTVQLS